MRGRLKAPPTGSDVRRVGGAFGYGAIRLTSVRLRLLPHTSHSCEGLHTSTGIDFFPSLLPVVI